MNAKRWVVALMVSVLGLTLSGCFDPFAPLVGGRGISTPAPTPNSPSGLLRLFEWAYNNRDFSQYRTVFTDDYRFAFAAQDTAGNRYRDQPYTRADELASAQRLFDASSNISLSLDKSFVIFNDTRPGKNDPLRRKNIRTQVLLNITSLDGSQTNVQGKANFFSCVVIRRRSRPTWVSSRTRTAGTSSAGRTRPLPARCSRRHWRGWTRTATSSSRPRARGVRAAATSRRSS